MAISYAPQGNPGFLLDTTRATTPPVKTTSPGRSASSRSNLLKNFDKLKGAKEEEEKLLKRKRSGGARGV